MHKAFVFSVLFFSLWLNIKSQADSRNKYDSLLLKGEYTLAQRTSEYYNKLSRRTYIDLLNLACINSLNGEIDSSFLYLYEALTKGNTGLDIIVDDDLNNLKRDRRWNSLEDSIVINLSKSFPKNTSLNLKILIMGRRNSHIRNPYFRAQEIFGDTSEITQRLKILADRSDSACTAYFTNLIDSIGKLPSANILYEKPFFCLILFYQHSPCEVMTKYYPYISIAFSEKQIKANEYAMATDRLLINCYGKEQIYGTQYVRGIDGKLILAGKFSVNTINENRKSIGLEVIK